MTLLRRVGSAFVGARNSSVSPLALISLVLGLTALLGLGWAGSPIRLHAPGAAVWAVVGAALGLIELKRAPRGSDWRFVAAVAIAVAVIALVEVTLVFVSFVPCGTRCV